MAIEILVKKKSQNEKYFSVKTLTGEMAGISETKKFPRLSKNSAAHYCGKIPITQNFSKIGRKFTKILLVYQLVCKYTEICFTSLESFRNCMLVTK